MRGLVIVLIVLVIIASFVVVANIGNGKEAKSKEQNKILEFSTFTSAVCENKDYFVQCKDEVFVNCNGEISKANGFVEFHPPLKYGENKETLKSYYEERRKFLDENGYSKYPLLVIDRLNNTEPKINRIRKLLSLELNK